MNGSYEIMCLDTSVLKADMHNVQKNIPLERLLKENTRFIYEDSLHLPENKGYQPLNFSLSVRSGYTNEVVAHNVTLEGTSTVQHHFYVTTTKVARMIHKGYDLVMFLASMSIKNMIQVSANRNEMNNIMFNSSIFDVMGLYYNGGDKPRVYSICTIQDESFKDFIVPNLATDYQVFPISDIELYTLGNNHALLNELVITNPVGDD